MCLGFAVELFRAQTVECGWRVIAFRVFIIAGVHRYYQGFGCLVEVLLSMVYL